MWLNWLDAHISCWSALALLCILPVWVAQKGSWKTAGGNSCSHRGLKDVAASSPLQPSLVLAIGDIGE